MQQLKKQARNDPEVQKFIQIVKVSGECNHMKRLDDPDIVKAKIK